MGAGREAVRLRRSDPAADAAVPEGYEGAYSVVDRVKGFAADYRACRGASVWEGEAAHLGSGGSDGNRDANPLASWPPGRERREAGLIPNPFAQGPRNGSTTG